MVEKPKKLETIAIIEAIWGLLTVGFALSAIPMMYIMGVIGGPITTTGNSAGMQGVMGGGSSEASAQFINFLIVLGIILVVLSVIHFLLAYSFWKGKSWGWNLGLIFPIVGIIGIFGIYFVSNILVGTVLLIPSVIFGLIIALYLTRPNIKAYFKIAGT